MWLVETLSETLLLMLVLTVLWRTSGQSSLADDLGLTFVWTAFVFMVGSGYLLTTAIFGVIWRSQKLVVYPAIAATLFSAHDQLLFRGWQRPDSSDLQIQVAGACIVFACTFVGNCLLRKWAQAGSKRPGLKSEGLPGSAGG